MHELQEFSTERAGRVELIERETDDLTRALLGACKSKILAAIEAELQRRATAS